MDACEHISLQYMPQHEACLVARYGDATRAHELNAAVAIAQHHPAAAVCFVHYLNIIEQFAPVAGGFYQPDSLLVGVEGRGTMLAFGVASLRLSLATFGTFSLTVLFAVMMMLAYVTFVAFPHIATTKADGGTIG